MKTTAELLTHAVVLTPPGRGAVAVILVTGPRAIEAIGKHFIPANAKSLAEQPLNAIRFGHWNSHAGEEVVVARRNPIGQSAIRNPQSAIVELHCHGGHAAAAAIVADLSASGCTSLDWQKFLRGAATSPIVAEAHIALANAPTERTATILFDQFHGALSRIIESILEQIDRGELERATTSIEQLLARAELGQHLTSPWRVVLAGPPNVGKSSLINALLGYGRSIVFDQPGTTRDVVTARTAIDGWPVELADTAGLRESGDMLEAAGVALATSVLVRADLVIFVSDAMDSPATGYVELVGDQRLLRVRNKIDLAPAASPLPGVLDTSARTGQGIEALLDAVARTLVPQPPEAGAAVPFTQPQQTALSHARTALGCGEALEARRQLQALLASPAAF